MSVLNVGEAPSKCCCTALNCHAESLSTPCVALAQRTIRSIIAVEYAAGEALLHSEQFALTSLCVKQAILTFICWVVSFALMSLFENPSKPFISKPLWRSLRPNVRTSQVPFARDDPKFALSYKRPIACYRGGCSRRTLIIDPFK